MDKIRKTSLDPRDVGPLTARLPGDEFELHEYRYPEAGDAVDPGDADFWKPKPPVLQGSCL